MDIEKRALSELKSSKVNVRKHTVNQIKEFKRSIEAFDVIRPIVIDENNTILIGHGLFMALSELGREYADVLVKRGLSEKQKKKLLLADNKIYSLGIDDFVSIEAILKDLATDDDFEIPGYDSGILEDLYGIKSVEKEVENGAIASAAIPVVSSNDGIGEISIGSSESEDGEEDVSPNEVKVDAPDKIQEARKEAEEERKVIICPHCGEKICL